MIWFAVMAVLAIVDWWAVSRERLKVRYFAKPGALLALILAFSTLGGWQASTRWFGIGLLFALIGDVVLLLPRRYFLFGLLAFLLTHIAYIIGLNPTPPPVQPGTLITTAVLAAVTALGFRQLSRGLSQRPETTLLLPAVLVYALAIGIMTLSAWLTLWRPHWPLAAALMVGIGATLFFISDFTLANHRLIAPVRHGGIIVIVTYHLGQALLIAGVLHQGGLL
ncbi:lysoplasmalogenase [uncultured Thermanaerothrix sp.]|uniref:lysoplasmalogenase n=1 Tax=uncultured Thermanaerothrix sp. TaxID=1195149 RepID=UPI002602FF55|nr:lysoplasmalogenase [uncultured Thermanaerothrix sp.]